MTTKRYIVAATALAAALAAPPVLAEALGNGLRDINSPHNFRVSWNPTGELCVVCHAPHDHGRTRFENGLLWNHELTTLTYTMYSSDTLDGAMDAQPTGVTKMCLGCHDGTVGLDQFGPFNSATVIIGGTALIPGLHARGDLRGTHPVSVVYDPSADPGLNPVTTPVVDSGSGSTSGTIADVLFDGGKVQCASCHDVHDTGGEVVVGTNLLRVNINDPAAPSELCLTCHKK